MLEPQMRNIWCRHCLCSTPCVCVLSRFSRVRLCATLWIVARQAPLSKGLSRQEHWSGLSCPPPEDHPSPGIEPASLTSTSLVDRLFYHYRHLARQCSAHWRQKYKLEHCGCPGPQREMVKRRLISWMTAHQCAFNTRFPNFYAVIGENNVTFCLTYGHAVKLLSRVRLFATPWTAGRQASLSITGPQNLHSGITAIIQWKHTHTQNVKEALGKKKRHLEHLRS